MDVKISFWLLVGCSLLIFSKPQRLSAQSAIITLDACGEAYIDPQDSNNGSNPQSRDTLLYTTFFSEEQQEQSYIVDINAFGGQQVDRVEVAAIMPDSSQKVLGQLSFGNCIDCVQGFALLRDSSLLVEEVSDASSMEMWIQSTGQPEFALPGNLQTLSGVGRISGTAPFCAIGLQVRYSVFSDPGNASTEFSTFIHCPEPVSDCQISSAATVNCADSRIELNADVPEGCFDDGYTARWSDGAGVIADSLQLSLPLSGNGGWYYFSAYDDCCIVQDSFWVEDPQFAEAGPDLTACAGKLFSFAGSGGQGHFWQAPDGSINNDSIYKLSFVQPGEEGPYVLHAFNEEGCEDTDTLYLTVNVPPMLEPSISEACYGDTLYLFNANDSAFQTVRWLTPTGEVLPQPFLPDFQAEDAGTYTLEGIDSAGCSAIEEVSVEARSLPVLDYAIEETCDTAFVYFFPPEWDYSWPGGSGNPLATATGGTFAVTVTDSLGCQSEQELLIPEPDGPEVQLLIDQPTCPGETGGLEIVLHSEQRQALFSIDGGEQYTLSDEFDGLQAGDYELVIRDALDCVQRFDFTIDRPDTMGVQLPYEPILVRPTTPVTLEAQTIGNIKRYQWVPEEINSEGPATSFIATRDLDIRLIVEDERGCLASAALPLTVELGDIYAPTAFSPNGDGRNDRFTIYSDNGSGEIIERLQVFNRWGDLVYEVREARLGDHSAGWDGRWKGTPLNTGAYAFYALVRYPNGQRRVIKGEVNLTR
jgi:gliding motility-associated-like protein